MFFPPLSPEKFRCVVKHQISFSCANANSDKLPAARSIPACVCVCVVTGALVSCRPAACCLPAAELYSSVLSEAVVDWGSVGPGEEWVNSAPAQGEQGKAPLCHMKTTIHSPSHRAEPLLHIHRVGSFRFFIRIQKIQRNSFLFCVIECWLDSSNQVESGLSTAKTQNLTEISTQNV